MSEPYDMESATEAAERRWDELRDEELTRAMGSKRVSDETPKSGSARRARARSSEAGGAQPLSGRSS